MFTTNAEFNELLQFTEMGYYIQNWGCVNQNVICTHMVTGVV